MASLISWGLDPRKKQQQQNNVLNTLNNLDVRTNNAVVNQTRDVRAPITYNSSASTNPVQNQNPANTQYRTQVLRDLSNLTLGSSGLVGNANQSIANLNQNAKNNTDVLAKLNQQNGGQNEGGKMSFGDFKATMNAKNAISQGGTGAPFKSNAINNARDLISMDKSAIGSLRNGDDGDYRYFTGKVMKPVLGDNADISGTTYKSILNSYNNASGDQQADIKKAISDEIINQREYAKKGSQGSLKVINYLTDLGQFLDKNGNYKGKSLGKQIGDYMATGGIANTLGRGVSELVNTIGGAIFGREAANKANAHLDKMDNSRQDLGAVGVADTALATATNYAANLGTAGLYGLINAGINDFNTVVNTIDDRILDYDDSGNAIIRHKTNKEKAGELGSAALNTAFAVAGKKGIGPSLEATGVNSATGLAKLSAKDLAKYAAKELPWAGGTTVLQTGLNNLSRGKDFFDMDAEELGKEFLLNTAQDVGMDAANYGTGKLAQRNAIKNGVITQDTNGNLIKRDGNYNVVEATEKDLNEIAKKAVDQNTLSSKALGKVSEKALLNELAKNNDLREQVINNVGDNLTDRLNFSRRAEMANAIENGADTDLNGVYMRQKAFDDANKVRKAEGKAPYDSRQTKLYAERTGAEDLADYPRGHYSKHVNDLAGPEQTVDAMERAINGNGAQAYPAKYENTIFASETANQGYYPASTAIDGNLGVRGISPREYEKIRDLAQSKSEVLDRGSGGRSTSTILSSSEDDLAGAPISGRRASDSSSDGGTSSSSQQATPEAGFPISSRRATESTISQKTKSVDPKTQSKYDNLREVLAQRREAENAPAKFETTAERNKKYDKSIKYYYNKYGDDFYEKMPDNLKEHYETMLDSQPRDKNGAYMDPITNEKVVNESVSRERVQGLADSWKRNQQAQKATPEVATGTDPLGKASDGTPEFVNRYTSQTTLPEGVDNSRGARKSRFGQFIGSLKGSDNTIVKKFYELATNHRKKTILANLSSDEAKRYTAEAGVSVQNDAKITMTDNIVRHMDNSGHLTGIRLEPELKSGIEIDANPLTKNDIAMLDQVIKNPDTIRNVGIGKEGQRLKIEKAIDNNMRVIAEVIPNGEEIKVIDYYKQNKNPLAGDLPTSGNSSLSRNSGVEDSTPATTLPNSISENTNKSKFAENISQNKNFSEEVREALKNDPVNYKPTTNEERLARANQILSTKSIDEVDTYLRDNYFNAKDGDRNSGDVVLAGELAKQLDAKGQYDRSTELVNKLSKVLSKSGQEIQAASVAMNRSPEGIANMAQSAIKNGGGDMTGELRGEIVKKTQEIGKIRGKNAALSEENAKITEQIMNGKGDLDALRKRQMKP